MPKVIRTRYYLGIDPGQSGGIVTVNSSGRSSDSYKMPSTELDIYNLLRVLSPIKFCLIEKVHSMPKQGIASAFKFGKGYGGLRMALIACEIPFDEVTPQKWQKGLSIPPKKKSETPVKWKNRLKQKAQQLFPQEKVTLATADALLIAEYCRRREEGLL